MNNKKAKMKFIFLTAIITLFLTACTVPHREHRMHRDHIHYECNSWIHHDHDDQHGGSYWHTHCDEDHP